MKTTDQIKDALAHFRCPACGIVDPGLIYKELQVCTFCLDLKTRRVAWQLTNTTTLEDEGCPAYEEQDFETMPVRCGHCEEVVTKPDLGVVSIHDWEEWLEDLGRRWVAQQQEHAVLLEKLKKEQESLPPLGTLAALEERIKKLEFIS